MQEISGETCYNVLDQSSFLFFYCGASWCGPCKQLYPSLIELSKKYNPEIIKFYKIDIDREDNKDICKKCEIKVVPSFLIFKDRTFLGRDKGGSINIPIKLINKIVFNKEEIKDEVVKVEIKEVKKILKEDSDEEVKEEVKEEVEEEVKEEIEEETKNAFIVNKQIFNKEKLKK